MRLERLGRQEIALASIPHQGRSPPLTEFAQQALELSCGRKWVKGLPCRSVSPGPPEPVSFSERSRTTTRVRMSMISETLTFPGASGDQLVARLERPDDAHWATVLFAHCFTCSKDLKAVRRISRALVDEGVAVFSFDFTGLGESEGDFADTNFSSNLDDLEAACRHLGAILEAPSLLLGHSLGGSAVLAVAERMPEVKAVATIGAPSDPAHLAGTLERVAPRLTAEAEVQISLGGRPFRIRQQLLEDLRGQRLREVIAKLSRPLLIFHSPIDDIVGIDHARQIYDAAKHPKSFISLDGADHLLLQNSEDATFIGRTLAAWMTRYIRPPTLRAR